MASLPAPDVNNRRSFGFEAEMNGQLRAANVALLIIAGGALVMAGCLGLEVHRAYRVLADYQPAYVRIDQIGRAEVVYYRGASYQPQAPEVQQALVDFTTAYFTRLPQRVDDYWNSKYRLSEKLMLASYQDDQKTQWIDQVRRGQGEQNDVIVDRFLLFSLSPSGGKAAVEYTKRFYENGALSGRTEADTTTYTFVFSHKIQGKMLEYNPIGLTITDMATYQGLEKEK